MAKVLTLENEKSSGKILIGLSSDITTNKLKVDDELMVYTGLSAIDPPLNPHQFDYRQYMETLRITHQMRLRADQFLTDKNPDRSVYGLAAAARHRIIGKLKEADFGKEELGIIQALLLGRRNDISPETYTNYKSAGAVHILAVSGLHIGIVLLLLQFLLRPLERLPKGKTLKLGTYRHPALGLCGIGRAFGLRGAGRDHVLVRRLCPLPEPAGQHVQHFGPLDVLYPFGHRPLAVVSGRVSK